MLNLFQHLLSTRKKTLKPVQQAQGPEYIEGQVQGDDVND